MHEFIKSVGELEDRDYDGIVLEFYVGRFRPPQGLDSVLAVEEPEFLVVVDLQTADAGPAQVLFHVVGQVASHVDEYRCGEASQIFREVSHYCARSRLESVPLGEPLIAPGVPGGPSVYGAFLYELD